MKKMFIVVLCISLIFSICGNSYADDMNQVVGLYEKIDDLFIQNNFSDDEIESMNCEYIDWFTKRFWTGMLPGLKATGKMKTGSDEEEYTYRLNEAQIDYDTCLRTDNLITTRYACQYAQAGVFEYLFEPRNYWHIGGCVIAQPEGFVADIDREAKNLSGGYIPRISDEGIELLRNPDALNDLLLKRGETEILDAKLFAMSDELSFLYLKGAQREYLVKVYCFSEMYGDPIPGIELGNLYSTTEVMDALAPIAKLDIYNPSTTLAQKVSVTKPIYEEEGRLLMEEDLIQGNDNGLDALKPLSRIEAITILVRALGYEDEPTKATSLFTDIPDNSWGVKYANIAADKGITMGVGDNKFAPDKTITANEFATLMLRSSDVENFDWEQAINLLIELEILTDEQVEKMDFFTRGDMMKIIYEAKENGLL